MTKINSVPIDSIKPDPNQPRKIFDDKHIQGLAKSLKVEGMINPIEVDSDMVIITGECRYRAAKLLGLKEVPVNMNGVGLSEYERFRRQMAENLHQSAGGSATPMNPIDIAKGYRKLIKMKTGQDYKPGVMSDRDIFNLMEDIPEELGVERQTILEYLRIFDQPDYVLQDIQSGVPRTYYREIERLPKEYRTNLKLAIKEGILKDRETIVRLRKLAKYQPDLASLELIRITEKHSLEANKILNMIIELRVALEADPTKFNPADKQMIWKQLNSLVSLIQNYIIKLE